ncbi:VWA domain-containing protein [Vibrio mediterranei]|uniref:VWA domain-containing protein n=1 Tax=Vibrio mediterranei TaxID=689 RepID=UPI001EFC7E99|nr:VWA domain-containing protein [Vibrio mediterranei]MCG9627818.1 VWA domain-containing protein [Vibrio mediterranei]
MADYFRAFHFLAPEYLWLVLPLIALIGYLFKKRHNKLSISTTAIAPHLLSELVEQPNKKEGYGPIWAVSIVLLIVIGTLSKPVWQVADTSSQDNPPLYVVMDESSSMNKVDIPPSRNLKAQLIVKHLLQTGMNRPISIIAMAGSSHVLLPPSSDQDLLALYLSYLAPNVMPLDGGDLSNLIARLNNTKGLKLDESQLLLVTDGVSSGEQQLTSFIEKHHITAAVLYLNELGLQTAKNLTVTSFDGRDMTISDNSLRNYFLNFHEKSSKGNHWQDESHWLIIILSIFVALWFRKGWTLQWTLCLLLLLPHSQTAEAGALDWFMTKDQQGMVLMYMGKFQQAEQSFQDPNWKGVACYYQENFKCAEKEFAKIGNAAAIFNMANAAAQDGRYKKAHQLYLALLEVDPNNVKAQQNLDKVDAILLEMKLLSENQHDQHPPPKDAPPPPKDVNDISDGAKRKSLGQVPHSTLKASDVLRNETATNKWLRDISRDPKDFIRRKFLNEYNRELN